MMVSSLYMDCNSLRHYQYIFGVPGRAFFVSKILLQEWISGAVLSVVVAAVITFLFGFDKNDPALIK